MLKASKSAFQIILFCIIHLRDENYSQTTVVSLTSQFMHIHYECYQETRWLLYKETKFNSSENK